MFHWNEMQQRGHLPSTATQPCSSIATTLNKSFHVHLNTFLEGGTPCRSTIVKWDKNFRIVTFVSKSK